MNRRLLLALVATLASAPALASPFSSPFSAGSADVEEDAAWHTQRDADADNRFQTIMDTNAVQAPPAKGEAMAALDYLQEPPQAAPPTGDAQAPTGQITLALDRWEQARAALAALRTRQARTPAPLVVLGASDFTGQAVTDQGGGGALHLSLDLQVTLHGDGLWKTVPLVGEEVVVVGARTGSRPVPLSSRDGYHVWVTQETGEVTLTLDLLVPSRGRRGSLEYEFLVAKTPVTRFACDFPTAGLEPRLRGAVQADFGAPPRGGTHLQALLAPTSRIHLVGFKDLGQDDGRKARLYAESLNLLSLDETSQELFTVLRYNILYAGQRQFDIAIPAGMSVVSADGEGAFRYSLEDRGADGGVVHGETAYPIRNSYEISLRLRRTDTGDGEPFTVALPRALGVEREYGWLGVEVPGNLKLEELDRTEALAVDVRQLPWEMVQSAVSPILRAWRYHAADATVRLRGTRLPDVEPASASIDRVVAETVVSDEGRRVTDMRITLRNRLRHSLRVTLPEGSEVRSTLLDGEPVKPSRASDGSLLFPLKRSAEGSGGLRPFTLQLVVEAEGRPMGLLGRESLALPSVELPVSSLSWSVWLPARNRYSALAGDVAAQVYAGAGEWYQAGLGGAAPDATGNAGATGTAGGAVGGTVGGTVGGLGVGGEAASADTGAMPVRIDLPRQGVQLSTARYWIEGEQAVTVHTWHARSWLRLPLGLGLFLLLGGGLVLATEARLRGRLAARPALLASGGLVLAGLALSTVSGLGFAVLAALLAGGSLALRHALHRRVGPALRAWWAAPAPTEPTAWSQRSVLSRLALVGATACTGLLLFVAALRWLDLVGNPL